MKLADTKRILRKGLLHGGSRWAGAVAIKKVTPMRDARGAAAKFISVDEYAYLPEPPKGNRKQRRAQKVQP